MNYATIENVEKGFSAVSDKLEKYESEVRELKDFARSNQKQLKSIGHAVLDASMKAGNYTGFWGSEALAKEFGGFVLASLGKVRDKSLDFIEKSNGFFADR